MISGISFNDYDIEHGKIVSIQGLDNVPYRMAESTVAGAQGARFSGYLMDKRPVTIQWLVIEDTHDEYVAHRNDVLDKLGLDKGTNQLLITKDGEQYHMDAVCTSLEFPPRAAPNQHAYVTGEFTAYDPVIYGSGSVSESAGPVSGGGLLFNLQYNLKFGTLSGDPITTLVREGQIKSYPTLILTGPLTNPAITNTATGEYFKLNYTLTTGETITINMNPRERSAILDSTGENLAQYVDEGSTWFGLEPGSNYLQITTSSSTNTGNFYAQWTEAYERI